METRGHRTRGRRTRTARRTVVGTAGVLAVGLVLAACSSTPAADQSSTTTSGHRTTVSTIAPTTVPVTTPPTTAPPPTSTPTTAPSGPKLLVLVGGTPAYEPASVSLVQDGAQYLSGLTWSSWSAGGASGSGTLHVNSCQPSCAQGGSDSYPATVTLSSAQNISQGYLFTSMSITVPSSPSNSQTFAVPR